MKITPAALGAAARGDMENFLVAATPGGIEAQEARGQQELCRSAKLPKDTGYSGISRERIAKEWGVVFKGDADDIFVNVELPKGWKLKPTDHSMWNDLLDEQGRKRAAIFYKAAFYDRSSHMSVLPRYSYSMDYDRRDKEHVGVCQITDGGTVIHETAPLLQGAMANYELSDAANKLAAAWLDEKYPNWKDPFAYWS